MTDTRYPSLPGTSGTGDHFGCLWESLPGRPPGRQEEVEDYLIRSTRCEAALQSESQRNAQFTVPVTGGVEWFPGWVKRQHLSVVLLDIVMLVKHLNLQLQNQPG